MIDSCADAQQTTSQSEERKNTYRNRHEESVIPFEVWALVKDHPDTGPRKTRRDYGANAIGRGRQAKQIRLGLFQHPRDSLIA